MKNSGQRWVTIPVSAVTGCDICGTVETECGVRVIEYRGNTEHRSVVVCTECIGRWIRSHFHMSPLRGC